MKHIIGFLVFAAVSNAQAIEIGCWDGTFGYNTMGFVEKDARFELSVRGSSIGALRFETSREVVSIRFWQSWNQSIHVPFAKTECIEDAHTKEITCEKLLTRGGPNFFVARDVANLDAFVRIITPLEAEKIRVSIKPKEKMTVEFIGANLQPTSTQKATVDLVYCDSQMSVKFPGDLGKFLEQSSHSA